MSGKNRLDEMLHAVGVDEEMKDRIMERTVRRKENNFRFSVRRIGKIAAAAVLGLVAVGTATVAGARISSRWNPTVAEEYMADEELQDKMLREGYAQDLHRKGNGDIRSVTQNGMTITAEQMLVDENAVGIYFDVAVPKSVKINDYTFIKNLTMTVGGDDGREKDITDLGFNLGYGFTGHGGDGKIQGDGKRHYGFDVDVVSSHLKSGGMDWTGKTISVCFGSLLQGWKESGGGGETLIKGNWDFHWKIQGNDQKERITIPLDKTIRVKRKKGTEEVKLEQIEIGPLSYRLDCRKEFVSQLDVSYRMKDGSVISRQNMPGNAALEGGGSCGKEGQMYVYEIVLDVDNLECVIIEGEEFPVK